MWMNYSKPMLILWFDPEQSIMNNTQDSRPHTKSFDLKKLTVFVEGSSAKSFLEEFVKFKFENIALACDFHAFQSRKNGDFTNLSSAVRSWWEHVQKQPSATSTPYKFLVITDADADAEEAKNKAEGIVQESKNKVDENLSANYEIIITPGNGANALEAALLQSVDSKFASVKKCAETFANCVEAQNPKAEDFARKNWADKVLIHAMLASSPAPDSQIWYRETFKYWNPESPELKRIFDQIRDMTAINPIDS
jgi:hypothetical protein